MNIIADITETAIINAGIEQIDLTEWLFTLKEHEYQACSTGHIACGTSTTPDGRRLSINVERVADNVLVQHYIEDISERNHCRVNSISHSFTPAAQTRLGVSWELKVTRLTECTCAFANRVIVSFTDEFLALLEQVGIADLEPIKAEMYVNVKAHNREETPLFAKDIESKALAEIWGYPIPDPIL